MPTYTFKCTECEKIFDDLVKIGEQTATCTRCNSIGERVWTSDSAPNFYMRNSWIDNNRVDGGLPQGEMVGDEKFKGDINDPNYSGNAP